MRGGAVVARWAHNPKVAGSSPVSATIQNGGLPFFKIIQTQIMRGGAVVARWAHNPKVAGSSPVSATKKTLMLRGRFTTLAAQSF